jgi:hypothetical protein
MRCTTTWMFGFSSLKRLTMPIIVRPSGPVKGFQKRNSTIRFDEAADQLQPDRVEAASITAPLAAKPLRIRRRVG